MGGLTQLFWGRGGISRTGAITPSLAFQQSLGTAVTPLGVSFHLPIEGQGPAFLPPWSPSVLTGLCCVLLSEVVPCPRPSCYSRTSAPTSFLGSLKRAWHTHSFPQQPRDSLPVTRARPMLSSHQYLSSSCRVLGAS